MTVKLYQIIECFSGLKFSKEMGLARRLYRCDRYMINGNCYHRYMAAILSVCKVVYVPLCFISRTLWGRHGKPRYCWILKEKTNTHRSTWFPEELVAVRVRTQIPPLDLVMHPSISHIALFSGCQSTAEGALLTKLRESSSITHRAPNWHSQEWLLWYKNIHVPSE